MHPMILHRNGKLQRNDHVASRGGNLRRRLRMAYQGWQRRRATSALMAVNDHWLKAAGIDRDDIEALVDHIVRREIPAPATASLAHHDQRDWQAAA